ncbi:right-handed parallel beta-helix repeat-containing protein [Kitasatospora mediocidica]|uniref:right-handed parallel beta-helix repeat-containing protein n=1 Tax=Kitasatospora mediocidica TaxID=58352 RepID=UPI000A05976C
MQPGQTVHVAAGTYPEQVNITHSGTAAAPITFTGKGVEYSNATFVGSSPGSKAPTAYAFSLSGVQHVRIKDFWTNGSSGNVLVDGSSDIALSGDQVQGWYQAPAIHVTGSSSAVTIAQNRSLGGTGSFGQVDPGAQGVVIATNVIRNGLSLDGRAALTVNGAPGTVVVNNTMSGGCSDALDVTGAATGTVIENNVISTGDADNHMNKLCDTAANFVGLKVDQAATAGTKVAYNVYDDKDGSPAYNWAGTKYNTVADYATASGQGSHDIIGNSELRWTEEPSQPASPLVDSADENAPGMTAGDETGNQPVDDPYTPNTGTGKGIRDRGAYELQNFGTYYNPLGPVRLLDTRNGTGVTVGAVAPGATVELPVTGIAGVPATGVTAVTMNVTVTDPTQAGFLTVYPHGDELPVASNLNWTSGETIPNLVTVQVKDGKVSFHNSSAGTVNLVADLFGYYSTSGSSYKSTAPVRLLDTRNGLGALQQGNQIDLQVAGVDGVPASGVSAVTLNVTVTGPTDYGYLTAYPHGTNRPTASNLNWAPGQTIPNLVTVPVVDGKVSLYAGGGIGSVHVVADLAGYFVNGGGTYHAQAPQRVADTRTGYVAGGSGEWVAPQQIGPGQTLDLCVTCGLENSTAVTLNVTVTDTAAPGFLTVYPQGTNRPVASNLNWVAGETIPNQVVVQPNSNGEVSIYNGGWSPIDLVVDESGYQIG